MSYRSPAHRGVTPQHRGRFPGFDVVDQADNWDAVTTGTVLARLGPATEAAFFTDTEVGIASALLDRLLAQDDEPKVPVLALIDARLAAGETDGWHYDDMPEDGQAWRESLRHLDSCARERSGRSFAEVPPREQNTLIQDVQDGAGAGSTWRGMSAKHLWSLWTRYACTAFYSHPWSWNEIGFSGPAYPRGYLNPGVDARERFEVEDHDDADPVPFASRIERERRRHSGGGQS